MGVTPEGRHVVKGIFGMYSSMLGIPLPDLIDLLWDRGCVIDWEDFYIESRKSGMSKENVHRLIRGGFMDSLLCRQGVEHVDRFFENLDAGRED